MPGNPSSTRKNAPKTIPPVPPIATIASIPSSVKNRPNHTAPSAALPAIPAPPTPSAIPPISPRIRSTLRPARVDRVERQSAIVPGFAGPERRRLAVVVEPPGPQLAVGRILDDHGRVVGLEQEVLDDRAGRRALPDVGEDLANARRLR